MKRREKDVMNIFFEGIPKEGDVLFLVSPLAWDVPLFCLHLLQAACRQAGITTHVFYSNLLYSIITGQALHNKIVNSHHLLLGERLFASAAFNHSAVEGYMDRFSDPNWVPDILGKMNPHPGAPRISEVSAPYREWIGTVDWKHLEFLTTQWIQSTAQRIADMRYRVVGCSTTFGGLVPSVALLNNIKKANANVVTIIGGALCEGEVTEGILSLKSGIDYIFSGEGELTFPGFVKQVLAGHLPGEKIICGETVMDLNTIPLLDYREYFDQIKRSAPDYQPSGPIEIPYETSRGCWYGKCTFCEVNGRKNFYREKSPDRILDDLKVLVKRHGSHTVFMTDYSMPNQYLNTIIPRISKEVSSVNIIYETRSNLTLEQVLSLKKAGIIRLIPGIESLSSSLLRRMGKGVTARENIAFLRYARSVNLALKWFLLYGFPGDQVVEYEEMLRLLPLIRHLHPPRMMHILALHRFNRYQMFPEAFGISNLHSSELYDGLFPLHAHREKIAYFFTGSYAAQSFEYPGIIIELNREVQAWKRAWAAYETVPLELILPTLHITRKTDDEYVLADTRGLPGRPKQSTLDRKQASILLVPRPQDSSSDYQWAVDAQLGVLMDSWFIPLPTAKPELLLEFERDYGKGE
ncbi:MAG: RiPP maturation radical SAM C-methyltransferase [Candidatus Aminicenantes bacterium]|nr:MAG: RiPP maturation radical SAM C-methyltransferase [Candidatus Aminicenantes bacterium]